MKGYLKKGFSISVFLLILFISLNVSFASQNLTDNCLDDSQVNVDFNCAESILQCDVQEVQTESISQRIDTRIDINSTDFYYNDGNVIESYLRDTNDVPIKNKQLNICLNGKIFNETTDDSGKVSFTSNLKPKTYNLTIKFAGDENLTASEKNVILNVKKIPLAIKMGNFNAYAGSDSYFKVKVYNSMSGNPVAGIRVKFKIYSTKTKKSTYHYATSDENGIARLAKDLKVGSYKISTQIKDSKNLVSYKKSDKKVTMKVNPALGEGCCSFYLQVSNTEAIAGFRRDSKIPVKILVKPVKWHGRTAVRQYKVAYSYFFHSITTSDGWMIGNGGLEGANMSKAIENLAGEMVKSNKIDKSILIKIQKYKKKLKFGHFSIKAPNGKFAVVWKDKIITGKLKPGEYFSSPNSVDDYRRGTYANFDKKPVRAAIKVGATDKYGTTRRCITVFDWKATTSNDFRTSSSVKVYASNDNGNLVGKYTANLKDNIKFKDIFFSKNSFPQSPESKFLGTHKFGNIDKLIKTPTIIDAPNVTAQVNASKNFKITVKNKNTNKVVSGVKIKIKIVSQNISKSYTIKTNKKGVAKLNTQSLQTGNYEVIICPANNRYLISAESKITII